MKINLRIILLIGSLIVFHLPGFAQTHRPDAEQAITDQPQPDNCTSQLIILSITAGSLLLVLLFTLIKFIRAKKLLEDLCEKVYEKILEEIASKLLVAAGIKEDEKLKEKIDKIVRLNHSRRKGEFTLSEYAFKVEWVLKN